MNTNSRLITLLSGWVVRPLLAMKMAFSWFKVGTATRAIAAIVGIMFVPAAFAADVAFQEHVILTDAWGFPSDNDYVADVDGDGDPDVVSCTRYSGAMWWFQNSGGSSPTFTTSQIDTHWDCRSVYAADLDGDGHTDLLSASAIGDGELRWYKNNGAATPSFTKRTIPTTAVDFFSVSSADLNGDGRMDILTGAGPSGPSSNQLAWHENKGGNPPTFVEHEISRSPAWPHSVKTVDLNNDGELDLVVGFVDGRAAAWYENNGASTPRFVQHMLPTPAGYAVFKVDVGDINGDGAIDIAIALSPNGGGVAWLKSSGGATPTFTRYDVDRSSTLDALAVSLADVDGDGDLDMFASPRHFVGSDVYSSDYAWYENLGGAATAFAKHTISSVLETPNPATAVHTEDVLAADFNGDGNQDVLARDDSYDYPARLMWYESTPPTFGFALKPTARAYGNQALYTSTMMSFWLTNKGTSPLPITSVGLVGTNPGMFSVNNRCGTSVAVGAGCSFRVTFRPTSVGDKSAKLRVVAGDNDVRTKALAGTGVVSSFTVSPTSLAFGSVPVNTTTAGKVVTISNTGSAVLPISSISLAGWNPYQFTQTHNCPANLAVAATCKINVVFRPTRPIGSKAALVNIAPGGGAAIRSVALAGAARN